MSQPPNYPPPPSPYGAAYSMAPAPRPTALTTAAIIGLVLSILSVLCNGIGLFGALMQGTLRKTLNQPAMNSNIAVVVGIVSAALLVVCILWIAISIGLLRSSRSMWSFGRGLAPLHIALRILVAGVVLMMVAPEQIEQAKAQVAKSQAEQGQSANAPSQQTMNTAMSAGVYGYDVAEALAGLALPITMLICLSRPSVKQYFEGLPAQ